jgi:hypothetical protein
MSFKIGDEVEFTFATTKLKGKVLEISKESWGPPYKVSYGDGGSTVWLHLAEMTKAKSEADCCCGLKFTREGGRHSDWCVVKNG